MSLAWYRCLGCGKPLSITVNSTIEEAEKRLRKLLGGKCPNCGRELGEKSRKLSELEEREFN